MKLFNTILPSRKPKKEVKRLFASIVCKAAVDNGVVLENNRRFLTQLAMKNMEKINKETLKYNNDLVVLWAKLDMEQYFDSYYELTVNPYYGTLPANQLDEYVLLPERFISLIDIKLVGSIKIDKIKLKKVFIATFEIKDRKENAYRPFVEFYIKNDNGTFEKVAYGYDTNNNKNVELFFNNFTYPIYLSHEGYIKLPLKNSKIKLSVYDYISADKMDKLLKNVYIEDIRIRT